MSFIHCPYLPAHSMHLLCKIQETQRLIKPGPCHRKPPVWLGDGFVSLIPSWSPCPSALSEAPYPLPMGLCTCLFLPLHYSGPPSVTYEPYFLRLSSGVPSSRNLPRSPSHPSEEPPGGSHSPLSFL